MFLSWKRILLFLLFAAGMLFVSSQSALAVCPNFNIPTTAQCAGGNCGAGTSFTSTLVEEPGKTYRYEWNFGDPDSGPANTSNLKQPNHTFSQPNSYTVSVKVFVTVGGVETEDTSLGCSETVTVAGVPDFKINVNNEDINLGPQEEEVCIEDLEAGVTLSPVPASQGGAAIPAGATFLWSNGSTDPTITVDEDGCYSVTITTTVNGVTCSRTNKVQVWGYKPDPASTPPQQQARWYFGNGAGVKFQGAPEAISGGAINTPEGTSTILDRKGNLLFYTDGRTVFDTLGAALPNGTGLAGGENSTQAVIIVPQPGCNSCDPVYYVFTTGDITPTGSRLEYNVVDLRLTPPVVAAQKNQLLTENSTERVISIKGQSSGANSVETTWIVTHDFVGNTFRVYPLTPAGLGAPQTYPGAVHTDQANGEGYMKTFQYTDPATGETKTRIAVVVPGAPGTPNRVEFFDFDPATGAVSGPVATIELGEPNLKAYGIEFAGDYVYVSLIGDATNPSKIVRYNLNPPLGIEVKYTLEEIVSDPAKIGALQAGPNGTIYIAVEDATSLWSIASPRETMAADVGLNRDAIPLDGPTSNLGLPTNADPENKGYGQGISFSDPGCVPAGTVQTIQFQAYPDRAPRNDGTSTSTYLWRFHDGTTSTLQNPTKAYLSPGEYVVRLTITNDCRVEEVEPRTVILRGEKPVVQVIPTNATTCSGAGSAGNLEIRFDSPGPHIYTLVNQADGIPIVYNRITPDRVLNVILPAGAYQLIAANEAGCEITVSTSIGNDAVDAPFIEEQTAPLVLPCDVPTGTLAPRVSSLDPARTINSIIWKDASNKIVGTPGNNILEDAPPGQYTLTVTNDIGCVNSKVFEILPSTFEVAVFRTPIGCDQLQLRAVPTVMGVISSPADYTFTWTINGVRVPGTASDAVTVNRNQAGVVNLVVTRTADPSCTRVVNENVEFPARYEYGANPPAACAGGFVPLNADKGDPFWDTYVWTLPNGSTFTGSLLRAQVSGVYKIKVSNSTSNCEQTDEVTVTINPAPTAPTVANPNVTICAGAGLPGFTANGTDLRWYADPALTQQLGTGTTFVPTVDRNLPGTYTYYVTQTAASCPSASTVVTLTINAVPVVELGPNRNVCQGETVPLNAAPNNVNGATYRWENGLTTPILNATRTGTYRVTVTLGSCVVRDSVTLTFVAPPETSIPRRTVPLCINDAAATATLDGGPGANFTYEWRKLGSPTVLGNTRTIIINSQRSNIGRYIVSIGNGGGCTRNDTIEIVDKCEPTVFVPDAFAPEGSLSDNQRLFVFGKYVGEIQMLIYNRWGELIHAHKGNSLDELRTNAWDGNYLGKPVPTGTYAWKITYRSTDFPEREPITLRGAVLLMR